MEAQNIQTIFLAGGSGFIGKNIQEQLAGKYVFLAPTSKELDLLDSKAVGEYFNNHSINAVIFAASVGGNRKQADIPDVTAKNLQMFLNVAANEAKFKKMIFLGSGAEYDKRQDLISVSEDDFGKSVPVDEYGLAKYKVSEYIATHNKIISLRCFGVYGKYEDPDIRFVSKSLKKALKGEPIIIYQNVFFDFLWVNDLVDIVKYFIDHQAKEKFYNVCTGERVDLITIAELIKKVSGKDIEIIVQSSGLAKEYTGSNLRLLREIPNLKFTPIEKGLKTLFEHLKN